MRGTHGPAGELAVSGFGELFVDQIQAGHVDSWKELMGGLVQAGQYSPNTVNSWLGVLRVVLKAAARELNLERVATDGVANLDASSHVTYSEEAPNALTPEQVPVFLTALKDEFPQHYGMAFLGLATGLRPSSLRPLRRKGEQADLVLDSGKLFVRRSQTIGETVLNTTKRKTRYVIELPSSVVEIMRWHIETQLKTPEQSARCHLTLSIREEDRRPYAICTACHHDRLGREGSAQIEDRRRGIEHGVPCQTYLEHTHGAGNEPLGPRPRCEIVLAYLLLLDRVEALDLSLARHFIEVAARGWRRMRACTARELDQQAGDPGR